jgi:hypothetical protein
MTRARTAFKILGAGALASLLTLSTLVGGGYLIERREALESSKDTWHGWDWNKVSTSDKERLMNSECDELTWRSRLRFPVLQAEQSVLQELVPSSLRAWIPPHLQINSNRFTKLSWADGRSGFEIIGPWFNESRAVELVTEQVKRIQEAGFEFVQDIRSKSGGAGLIEWRTRHYDQMIFWFNLHGFYADPINFRYLAVERLDASPARDLAGLSPTPACHVSPRGRSCLR